MSNQNRFLLPHTAATASASSSSRADNQNSSSQNSSNSNPFDQENNQLSVDTDFDSYWEEEARNPHRNRIRIGRQYQATVPPLLKPGEKDLRKLEDLETLSFCPKKSARVSDAELDHYFKVAKSLNLFASLVETRSLLGRDVTIADLNHIRHKEGLSLASVIQPVKQQPVASYSNLPNVSPLSSQQSANNPTSTASTTTTSHLTTQQQSPQKSPPTNCDRPSPSTSSSPKDQASIENFTLNQPLMKALSHFISLHHPCHHDRDCKKLLKDIPLENDSGPVVSITAGNLRQGSSSSTSKESKPGRSRSSLKQASVAHVVKEDTTEKDQEEHQGVSGGDSVQSPTFDDWTREEVELFSKAIEVCGKNFGSIKKEFLPSKSVMSIVEYYYIGSRDVSESKKKSNQSVETSDGCSSPEKSLANNNGQGGGGGGGGSSAGAKSGQSSISSSSNSAAASSSRTTTSSNDPNRPNKTLSDSNEETKQASSNQDGAPNNKTNLSSRQPKTDIQDLNGVRTRTKNIDARMSVYNFDEEFKEDSPVRFDCPRAGAEVKPLKAKPIIPNAPIDSDASNSKVGTLKFYREGEFFLKLNACQVLQEGIEKCHWVQSGDNMIAASKQKRYTKRTDKSLDQNGSQSNSVVSSYQDDDSKNDDLTGDEDSKESMNSFTNLPQQIKNNHGPATPKRLKIKSEPTIQEQLPSPINYNRMAVNNRTKERNDNLNPSPVINQAAMPWLQANSFAMAAALLGGLPFPQATGNNLPPDNPAQSNVSMNMASKPMDLSLEHGAPKTLQKSSSRSRSRPKN